MHKKKTLIEDPDEIIMTAAKVIEASMKEGGELYELAKEYQFTGTYTIDITVHGKGLVASVFIADREEGSIAVQNRLKDYIKEMKMGFRMPKGKKYKFRYKFKF